MSCENSRENRRNLPMTQYDVGFEEEVRFL